MKYWVCKRAAPHAAEALECLGGNGFVEDSGLPLLYRDAPLNSIWEGSGNVAALDVLRAMVKEPDGLPAFLAECELAAGADARLDAHLVRVRERAAEAFASEEPQFQARRIVEDLAVALQASLLVRCAPPRWPMRSARPGSATSAGTSTGRCRRASTPARSSTARCRRDHARGPRHARAAAGGRARADRGGRVRLGVGGRDRRARRRRRRNALPALRLEGGPVRGRVPLGLCRRGARDADGRRDSGPRVGRRAVAGGAFHVRAAGAAATGNWRGPSSPSRSTRAWTPSGWPTERALRGADRATCSRPRSPPARCRRRTSDAPRRRSSAGAGGAGRAAVAGGGIQPCGRGGRRSDPNVRSPRDRRAHERNVRPGRARRSRDDRAAVAPRAPQRRRRRHRRRRSRRRSASSTRMPAPRSRSSTERAGCSAPAPISRRSGPTPATG